MMYKRIQVLSVVVFLILVLCPLSGASADCDFSYSNYARAVQLHDMGDYDAALRHYHCALEEDPDDAVIPLLIANVHEDIAHAGSAWSSSASPTTAEILELPPVSTWGERVRPSREQDFQDLIVEESRRSQPLLGLAGLAQAGMPIAIGRSGNSLWLFYAASNSEARLLPSPAAATSDIDPVDRRADLSLADRFIKEARNFVGNLDWARARIRFEQALDLDPSRIDIRRELNLVYQDLRDAKAPLLPGWRDG